DPGPEGLPERRWTRMIANGLMPGDQVTTYATQTGAPISHSVVSRTGVASIDAVVEPGVDFTVSHVIPAPLMRENPTPPEPARRTLLIQRRLTELTKLDFGEPVDAVAAGILNGRRCLLVGLKSRQLVYDLTHPSTPRLQRIEEQ